MATCRRNARCCIGSVPMRIGRSPQKYPPWQIRLETKHFDTRSSRNFRSHSCDVSGLDRAWPGTWWRRKLSGRRCMVGFAKQKRHDQNWTVPFAKQKRHGQNAIVPFAKRKRSGQRGLRQNQRANSPPHSGSRETRQKNGRAQFGFLTGDLTKSKAGSGLSSVIASSVTARHGSTFSPKIICSR